MKIRYYHVDAFASRIFSGNPAGVCLLDGWIDEGAMQSIAAENKHSETAFLVPAKGHYELRWFTPAVEIDLCGHATLASAHVLFNHEGLESNKVRFETKSGTLTVSLKSDILEMDFPSRPPVPCSIPEGIKGMLGIVPVEAFSSRDLLLVYEDEDDIRSLSPDFNALLGIEHFVTIATAPGRDSDFVSRCFAPGAGIPEDPVTGSAHCTLIPFWAERLQKDNLHAQQLSQRGGELFCSDRGERVIMGGRAVTYMVGEIVI